jgi:hypothetical protein
MMTTTTIRGFRPQQPNTLNESRVRLPDTTLTTLFGGWGIKL